jgi:amidase
MGMTFPTTSMNSSRTLSGSPEYPRPIHSRLGAFFDEWDVLLCPHSMVRAFPHREPGSPQYVAGQEVAYRMVSAHGTVFNDTGHPAVVLPYKLDRAGLLIGVQPVGKRWSESRLLTMAKPPSIVLSPFQRLPGY